MISLVLSWRSKSESHAILNNYSLHLRVVLREKKTPVPLPDGCRIANRISLADGGVPARE